ncbi:MAG: hypothetical protein KatS3mg077_2025 [Candidatus Binatia bacterium]|nr:MAG: hypothetical protein KatS3mg077_2025 [Candidatus Binatia bacterium]
MPPGGFPSEVHEAAQWHLARVLFPSLGIVFQAVAAPARAQQTAGSAPPPPQPASSNGLVRRFGETESARVLNGSANALFYAEPRVSDPDLSGELASVQGSADCTWTGAWGITSTTDPNTNRVDYSYVAGVCGLLPSTVQWGANALAGQGHVCHGRFEWIVPANRCAIREEVVQRGADTKTQTRFTTVDLNGDAIPDFVDASGFPWLVYLGYPPSGSAPGGFLDHAVRWEGTEWSSVNLTESPQGAELEVRNSRDGKEVTHTALLDMNGDGLLDFVETRRNARIGRDRWLVLTNKGRCSLAQVQAGDVSGCGFDIVYINYGNAWLIQDGFRLPLAGQGGWSEWYAIRKRKSVAYDNHGKTRDRTGVLYWDVRDMNGDRLPDLVIYDGWGCDGSDPGCLPRLRVYLNEGSGFAATAQNWPVHNIYCGQPAGPHYTLGGLQAVAAGRWKPDKIGRDLVDINGDGLPDLVSACTAESNQHFYSGNVPYPNEWIVQINQGNGFVSDGDQPLLFRWGATSADYIRWFYMDSPDLQYTISDILDVDGDGLVDRVSFGWCTSGGIGIGGEPNTPHLVFNPHVKPDPAMTDPNYDRILAAQKPNDMLVAVENGIGALDRIEYQRHYNSGTPFPLWVVKKIRRSDGLCDGAFPWWDCARNPSGHELESTFAYFGGLFERNDREFRGFRTVQQSDGRTRKTTLYYQDAVRKGLVQEVVTEPEVLWPVQSTMERGEDFWDCADITSVSPANAAPPPADPQGANCPMYLAGDQRRWWVRLVSTKKSSCASSSTCATTAKTTAQVNDQWDDYGNVTRLGKTETGAATGVLEFVDFYHWNTATTYMVDKPAKARSLWGSALMEFKWFSYNDVGDLVSVHSWLNRTDTGSDPGQSCPENLGSGSCTQVHMRYDAFGNLLETTDALGRQTTTVYDALGLFPVEVSNPLGQRVAASYDLGCGTLLSRSTPYTTPALPADWPTSRYEYDAFCRLTRATLPGQTLPDQAVKYYLGRGGSSTAEPRATAVRIFKLAQSGYYYPSYNMVEEFRDAFGRSLQKKRTAVAANNTGDANETKHIVSDTTQYDAYGSVSVKFAPFAEVPPSLGSLPQFSPPQVGPSAAWMFDYDGLGRLARQSTPDGASVTFERTTPWVMRSYNQCYSSGSTNNRGINYGACTGGPMKAEERLDGSGRTVEKLVWAGNSLTFQSRTIYRYDGLGRLVSTAQASSATENPDTGTTVTRTRVTTEYDSLGRKVLVSDPDSGTWRYGYDLAGNLVYQNDPKTNQSLRYTYDALNRMTAKIAVAADTRCTPGAAGCPVSKRTHYRYDQEAADRVVCHTAQNCPKGDCALGRLAAVEESDANGVATGANWMAYCYDIRGNRRQVRQRVTLVDGSSPVLEAEMRFAYHPETGALQTITYPDGEVVRYDYTVGYVTAVGESGGSAPKIYVQNLVYDLFGRPVRLEHGRTISGNDVRDEWLYYGPERNYRLRQLRTVREDGAILQALEYDYQANGKVVSIFDGVYPSSDVLSNAATLEYDGMGRLTRVSQSQMNGTYTFDVLQNLRSKDGQNFQYPSSSGPHQAGSFAGQAVSHDVNGNRTGWGSWGYVYDGEDRLTEVWQSGTPRVKMVWGPAGDRVAKVVGSAATLYVGRWMEVSPRFVTKYYYVGDRLVASRRGGRTGGESFWASGKKLFDVAGLGEGKPGVVVRVTEAGARVVSWGLVVATVVVLLSPQRRRAVVGVRPSAGGALMLVLVIGLSSAPLPVVVMPAWAGGGGGSPPPGSDTLGLMHYHLDHLGSTQILTREDGSVFRYVRYTAYGKVRGSYSATGASASGCGDHEYCREFTGYDTEPVSGLAFAVARFYQPELGMFLTHDPLREYANPYAYGPWDPMNGTDPTGASWFAFAAVLALIAAGAVAIDVGVRTGDAGAALKAGAVTFLSSMAMAAGVEAGLGIVATYVSAATMETVTNVLAVVGLASGGYGVAEAARNGMYASAVVGALLLAAGAYRVLSGNRSVGAGKNPGKGSRGLSTEEQLNFARQHFGLRFGGNFRVYDVPIIPGYGDPDSAALAVLTRVNPQSIAENTEYGGLIYRERDGFFDFTPPLGGTPNAVELEPAYALLPTGAQVTGFYHTHADYGWNFGGTIVRGAGPVDGFGSDFFSLPDLRTFHSVAEWKDFFRGYLGTPSGALKAYDPHRLVEYPLL